MRYAAVLFDAGETLIGPRAGFGEIYASVLGSLGIDADPGELERGLRAAVAASTSSLEPGADRYAAAPGGEAGYWRSIVERTLRATTPGTVDHGLVDAALVRLRAAFAETGAWRVYDDVLPTLESLAALGCRLAVVSNWDSRLPDLLERLGLRGRFDALAVSHLEGVEKPSPRLFEAALERLGVAPADALHVGNVPAHDLDGGHAAGVDVLLVDRGSGEAAAWNPVTSFDGLPELVAGRPGAALEARVRRPASRAG